MTTTIKINQNDGVTPTTATGGETTIDFDFPIFDADHLQLFETDTAGVLTELIKDTHYSVPSTSVDKQAGGVANLLSGQYPAGATAGHKFTARLNVPEERTTDFQPRGDFFAETLNKELDLMTQRIQQLRRDVNSSATFRADVIGKTPLLPEPADNQLIAFEGTDGTMKTVALADLAGSFDTLLSSLANNNFVVYETAGGAFVNKTVTEVQQILGVIKNNYEATTDPTINDDEADGYTVGSRWINNTDGDAFFCADATLGAASWTADNIEISDLGGAATKDFTTDLTSPDNTTVPGSLAVKQYVDGKDPVFNVQCQFPDNRSGSDNVSIPSGSTQARPINTLIENEITGAGIVYDLPYDAQSANFTAGQVVTGGTSGATGTIVADTDAGTDGTLKLIDITGTFTDDETITDPLGGSADVNAASGQTAASQVWLPANTYRLTGIAMTGVSSYNQLILYNATDDSEIARGFSDYAASDYSNTFISAKFTLAADSLVELRHFIQSGGTQAFGLATSQSMGVEIYTDLKFWAVN